MDNYEAEAFISEKLSSKLKDDEQILWCGGTVSDATPKERGVTIFSYILPVIWIGIVSKVTFDYFKTAPVTGQKETIFMIIFFGLFYLAGINMIFSLFTRKKQYYAITNRRALVMSKRGSVRRSTPLTYFRYVMHSDKGRNVGVVRFVRSGSGSNKVMAFTAIENPAAVRGIAENAIEQAKTNGFGGVSWSY